MRSTPHLFLSCLVVSLLMTPRWCNAQSRTGNDAAGSSDANLAAVIKVYSKNRTVSLTSPWRRQTPRSVSGSGVIIGEGLVLTNAHVILNTTEITLQPTNSSERIPATLKIFARGIDLALLEFEPEGALLDVPPMKFVDKSPPVQAAVRVYGYPTGGDAQSVTEGIISRIEHTSYRYGTRGMRIQIDAAINSGNSGGPAVVDGKIAGIAFSTRRNANDIGYVIPVEEIQKFLTDVKDGTYDGKPVFNVHYQYLENRTLRRQLKMPPNVTGTLFRHVREAPNAPFQEGDIITNVAGFNVDNRGRCRLENDVSLSLTSLAMERAIDGQIPVTVLRNGKEQILSAPVETREKLIPYITGNFPRYFVYGPIVFSEASADYLAALDASATLGDANQRRAGASRRSLMQVAHSPLLMRRSEYRGHDSEGELVVVTRILTHSTTRGYRSIPYPFTVKSIDNQPVTGFAQMVGLLRDAEGEFIEIKFHDTLAEVLVLDREQLLKATDSILENNAIVRQGSRDLMKVWSATE